MPRFFPPVPLVAAFTTLWVWACAADAHADDLKDAEKLYGAAAKAMAGGDYEHACPKFEAAREKAPEHVRTGMTLAQCYSEWGKTGQAFEELGRVRAIALAQKKQDKVQAIDEALATLKANAPTLTIRVPKEVRAQADLSILRDGKNVPESQWDVAIPVNPGRLHIEATASGKEHWETSVDVAKPSKGVAVEVLPPTWGIVREADLERARVSKMRIAGFVGLGIGVAGLAVGSILGATAISRGKDGAAYCNAQNACTQTGYDLRLDAYHLGNGSTTAFIAGGVFLGAGVLMLGLAAQKSSSIRSDAMLIMPMVGPAGVGIQGLW